MHVCVCIYNMYVCVYSCVHTHTHISMYVCMYVAVNVCMHVWCACVGMHMCECVNSPLSLYMVAWYSDTDLFGEIRTRYRRLGLVFVMDPRHWRLEDRPMR